jgi:hypothetical protein
VGIKRSVVRAGLVTGSVMAMLLAASSAGAGAQPGNAGGVGQGNAAAERAEHWTPARRAAATPRDLVIDHRGLGYLKGVDGSLQPYGHSVAAAAAPLRASAPVSAVPRAKPVKGPGDTNSGPPAVEGMDPDGTTAIGESYDFRAVVTDPDGIKSVDFVIEYPDGRTQSFSASAISGAPAGTYGVNFSGFTGGDWSWWVVARDNLKRGALTTTEGPVSFEVEVSGGEPPTPPQDGIVTNAPWADGGDVQTAAGRIYFEMPSNRRGNRWSGYVCSGTAVDDTATGTSTILTAAHCVYDDANKAFARNVLFIPNQAATTGSGTDRDCDNDPLGCWAPTHGVVHESWSGSEFPANIPSDFAYYVVPAAGAHSGAGDNPDLSLESTAGTLPVQFVQLATTDPLTITNALGYSYSDDPNFMYCAEGLEIEGEYDDYWLPNCDLSGGSSGGPWIQPAPGDEPVVSVNSWGYTNSPGMAGPPLTTTAKCVFDEAQTAPEPAKGRGIISTC